MKAITMKSFLFLMLSGILLAGCAAKVPSGKWEVTPGVQQAFEAGTILPHHTYYYLGSSSAPDSVIAIDNHYTLRTKVWAQVDLTKERLNGWLNWYRTEPARDCEYYGGVILTPDGKQAGVWYSQNIINIIQMPEPGVLVVYQPHSVSLETCGSPDDGMGFGGRL